MILRRKQLPAQLVGPHASFTRMLEEIEPAKAALMEVMPTTRLPGRPLPDALQEFDKHLAAARARMPGWRTPETDDVWTTCEVAIDESLDRSRRLREEAPALGGFEGLIWAVEHLMDPLDAFESAATRFRDLRAR